MDVLSNHTCTGIINDKTRHHIIYIKYKIWVQRIGARAYTNRNDVFLEKQFISKGNSGSKVLLEEIKELQITAEDRNEIQDDSQDVVEFESVTQGPRRSGRIRHEP